MLFNKFRKKEEPTKNVPWRDSTGKVVCQGDCPDECNAQCPIWLNTVGLELMCINQFDAAIKAFQDAVAIAPDFPDAHNNLASTYGRSGRHQEAYDEFLKAYNMKKPYPQALLGLIVSSTKLGKTAEALAYCDEYDQIPGCSSADLRKALM